MAAKTRDVALLSAVMLMVPHVTFAYIDGGTGSLVYQTLLAAMLGAGFVMRQAVASIFKFLRKSPRP